MPVSEEKIEQKPKMNQEFGFSSKDIRHFKENQVKQRGSTNFSKTVAILGRIASPRRKRYYWVDYIHLGKN